MPLYEYQCGICNAITEIRHEYSDDVPKTIDCLICGYPAGRILSSFNIGSTSRRNSSEIPYSIGTVKATIYKISGPVKRCPHGYDMMIVNRVEQGTVTVPISDPEKIRMN